MAQITHSQLAHLFRRLATGYGAGIDLKSIYTRETELGSPAYRAHSRIVVDQIRQGRALADAYKSAGSFFPDLVIAVVGAGEQGGRLEEAFERLAAHYENLVRFRNGFLISIAWPLFELAFAICIIGVMILLLGALAGDESANWFGMGSPFANFLFYVFCVATVVSGIAAVWLGIKYGWFGTLPMRIARRIPLVGRTVEALALSRLAWTMSISENAGMDAMETARMSLAATQNFFYRQLEHSVCNSVQAGNDFTTALRNTQAFPEEFLIYVENGELAGALAESMDRASKDLQTRAENYLKLLGTIGFVCTFLLVAAVIGTVVITMVQKFYLNPINDLLNM